MDSDNPLAEYAARIDAASRDLHARMTYTNAMMDLSATPEAAAEQMRAMREHTALSPTDEDIQKRKAEEDYNAMGNAALVGAFRARLSRDLQFANYVKGDLANVGVFESAYRTIAGEGGKPDGLWQSLRNSIGRGGAGLQNAGPVFGNVPMMTDTVEEIERIKQGKKAIAEDRISEFFGTPDDPSGMQAYYNFLGTADRDLARLEAKRKDLEAAIAHSESIKELYPVSDATQAFMNSKGFADSVGAFASSPIDVAANIGPEMLIEIAPMLLAAFATSGTGVAAVAATQGAYSYGLDRNSMVLEGMRKAGIDTTNATALNKFFSNPADPVYQQVMREADLHAAPVAAFDALSVPLALARLPASLGPIAKIAPSADRAYTAFMKAPVARHTANGIMQMQLQGIAGGTGEALGQIAAYGEVQSWADVVAEFVGEHFSAPFEMMNAARAASHEIAVTKAATDVLHAELTRMAEAAQQSSALATDPEPIREVLEQVQDEHPLFQRIPFDVNAMSDEAKQALAVVSPEFAAALRRAKQSGEDPTMEYKDIVTMAKQAGDKMSEFINASYVPMQMSNGVLELVAQNQVEAAARRIAREERNQFRESLRKVTQEMAKLLDAVPEPANRSRAEKNGTMTTTEKRHAVSLVAAHVAAMAADSGMTPEQVWQTYGLTAVGAEKGGTADFSGYGKDVRGMYLPQSRRILLSMQSNKSTFFHETGHWFIGTRMKLALALKAQGNLTPAQERFIKTTEDAVKWMSGKSLEEYDALADKTTSEEQFATHYEAYLREGRAPTEALLYLFRSVGRWIKAIYAAFGGVPGTKMTDDVRQLFDALFVSSEEATKALLMRGIYDTTDAYVSGNANESDVAAAIQAAYVDLEDEVREKLTAAYLRDVERLTAMREGRITSLTREAEKQRQTFYNLWRRTIAKRKVEKALDKLNNGFNGKVYRLAKPTDGSPVPSALAQYYVTDEEAKKNGWEITDEATLAAMMSYKDFASFQHAVETRIDPDVEAREYAAERMLREYGEMATPEAIRETADKAIYGKAMERLLMNELGALDALTDGRSTKALKYFFEPMIEAMLGRIRLQDLNPRAYRADAAKAANEAQAYLTGKRASKNHPAIHHDTISAGRAKRKEYFHTLKAKMAQQTKDSIKKRVDKLLKYMKDPEKGEKYDTPFLEQVQAKLYEYGLSENPPTRNVRGVQDNSDLAQIRQSYADFVQTCANEGIKGLPTFSVAPRQASEFNQYTVNEINAVLDDLEELAKMGSDVGKLRYGEKQLDAAEKRAILSDKIREHARQRGWEQDMIRRGEGPWSQAKKMFRAAFMAHRRIPSLLDCMEGTRFGEFFELIGRPFNDSGSRQTALEAEYTRKYFDAVAPLRKLTASHKYKWRNHLDGSFNDAEIVAIALNLNSEENLARLIEGSDRYEGREGKPKWTKEQIIAEVQETLSAEQLAALQNVWDVVGGLWDEVVALEHRMNHRAPVAVKPMATTFTLPDGTTVDVKGGYYPIRYDSGLSEGTPALMAEEDLNALAMLTGMSRSPSNGHTQQRARNAPQGQVVELTLTAGAKGLSAIIHDLCWRESLANANHLFRGELRDTIKHVWGPEAMDAIDNWLLDLAAGGNRQMDNTGVIADVIRRNVSIAGLGFNLVTAAIQLTGYTQTLAVLGPKWAAIGVGDFMKSIPGAIKMVRSKSQFMAERSRTQFRELGEAHAMLTGNISKPREVFMRFAYSPIVIVQSAVDIPTWLGAYNWALSEGCTEAEAVARADKVVLETQGSGRLQDMSAVERGGAWAKLFTTFYTFFNATLNLAMALGHTETGMKRAAKILMILAVQPILEGALREAIKIKGDDDDEEKKFVDYLTKAGKDVVGFNMGLFVGIREASDLLGGTGYRGPAGLRKAQDLARLYQQIEQGEVDEAAIKAAVSFLAVTTGAVPAVPINRAISGANALANDETDNWLAPFLGYSKY